MGLGKGAEAPTSVAVVMIYQQKYNNTLGKTQYGNMDKKASSQNYLN